ncbi:MAG: hypothetical protein OCD76_01840 [Reichenbachiella sp.]
MNDLKDIREMRVFDYLEGNLSPEETITFDNDLLYDSYLKDELNDWKQTYVPEEDFDTTLLEATLIDKIPRSYSILKYLNIFLILSLSFISGHQIYSSKKTEVAPARQVMTQNHLPTRLSSKTITSNEVLKPSVRLHLPLLMEDENTNPILVQQSKDDFELVLDYINAKNYKLINPEWLVSLHLNTRPYKVARKKYIMSRADIRKRARQSSRYKRKELERRQALEFQKGNTPYVVPIDMTRF